MTSPSRQPEITFDWSQAVKLAYYDSAGFSHKTFEQFLAEGDAEWFRVLKIDIEKPDKRTYY